MRAIACNIQLILHWYFPTNMARTSVLCKLRMREDNSKKASKKASCHTLHQPCGVAIIVRMGTTISPGGCQATKESCFGPVRPHQH